MNLLRWLTFLVILAAPAAAESNYREDFARLKREVPQEKMEAHLAAWRKREAENPDAWILSANWYFEQAHAVTISTNPAGKGGIAVTDPKTGQEVGSIGESAIDPARANKAVEMLSAAVKRFPKRLDIHCGLAHLLQECGRAKEEVGVLRRMVTQYQATPEQLRWCHGEPLSEPPERFVAAKLHTFALAQYHQETREGNLRFCEIAKLATDACPTVAKLWNDRAICASLHNDFKAVQGYLDKAAALAPTDALVLVNLGDNSLRLGLKKKARDCFARVIELNSDADLVARASEALADIDRAK